MKIQTNFVNFVMVNDLKRIRITIRGAVQEVGCAPFICCLANKLKLTGWVLNYSMGVLIETEGEETINLYID